MIAFHTAGESLTFADTSNINLVTNSEKTDIHFVALFQRAGDGFYHCVNGFFRVFFGQFGGRINVGFWRYVFFGGAYWSNWSELAQLVQNGPIWTSS